jgi:hypothetical protein
MTMGKRWFYGTATVLLLWLGLTMLPLRASSPSPAGHVIIAVGEVTATSPDDITRPLERRAPVFEGDIVRTGANARTQIRFRDDGAISLDENSVLHIETFRYKEDDRGDVRSVMRLIKGGLRSITGAIGRIDPAAYLVESAPATIGIRGTYFELFLDEALSVAVWRGRIRVSNRAGSIDLGDDTNYRFAVVSSADEPPEGRMNTPSGIHGSVLPPLEEQGVNQGTVDLLEADRLLETGIEGTLETGIGGTVDTTVDTLGDTVDTTIDTLEGAVDTTVDTLGDTVDTTVDTVGNVIP